jgi:hypothetical protein
LPLTRDDQWPTDVAQAAVSMVDRQRLWRILLWHVPMAYTIGTLLWECAAGLRRNPLTLGCAACNS